MANRLDNNHDNDRCDLAMALLSDAILKMKKQFGSRIKEKAALILKRVQHDDNHSAVRFLDYYSPVYAAQYKPEKKKNNESSEKEKGELIDRFRKEIRELNFKNYTLKTMLTKTEDSLNKAEMNERQLARELERANSRREESHERSNAKRARTIHPQKRRSTATLSPHPDSAKP